MARIPEEYRESVLDEAGPAPGVDEDAHCIAQLRLFRSLLSMARDARKPIFALKPADVAFGGHQAAVATAAVDFAAMTRRILTRVGVTAQ